VNRDEQIRPLAVGNRGAGFERYEGIVLPCVNHLGAQSRFQQPPEALGHVEHYVFFEQAVGTDGACVVPAVTGIDDDLADLQPQCASQGTVAAGGGASFAGFRTPVKVKVAASAAARDFFRRTEAEEGEEEDASDFVGFISSSSEAATG